MKNRIYLLLAFIMTASFSNTNAQMVSAYSSSGENSLPPAIIFAARTHIVAQSLSSLINRISIFTSGSSKQALAQYLHSVTQS